MVIGHDDGIVTIDLAESDDPHWEQVRQEMGEPYRTMLGHLRHETGHYYWEDWAETSAHYMHIRDTPQTAAVFGYPHRPRDEALSASPIVHVDGKPFELTLATGCHCAGPQRDQSQREATHTAQT